MPIYFGLPVSLEEAYRLFDEDDEDDYGENLNDFFKKENMKMRAYSTDKGQYIIGYVIHSDPIEGFDGKNGMKEVDSFIILLTNLKTLYHTEINKYKKNFKNVTLQAIENESIEVEYPQPYIIDWTN